MAFRWIVELLEQGGIPVKRFVATGGLPHHNPLLLQIYADVLGKSIMVHPSKQGPAMGAAILGALAAGPQTTGFRSVSAAINAMAKPGPARKAKTYRPNRPQVAQYDKIYPRYRNLGEWQMKFDSSCARPTA